MNHQRLRLDHLPTELIDASQNAVTARSLVEATEHNIEDLLLCLEALRSDDVPHIGWDWEENQWQPELVSQDHYPQCYRHATPGGGIDYHVIWSVPLCRRDPAIDWRDAERYFQGSGRQVLLFEYMLSTEPVDDTVADLGAAASGSELPARLLGDSISVWLGLHEGVPLQRVTAIEAGNKIKVDLPLLVSLAESIDALKSYLALEKQATAVLQRRMQRLKERDLHTNE